MSCHVMLCCVVEPPRNPLNTCMNSFSRMDIGPAIVIYRVRPYYKEKPKSTSHDSRNLASAGSTVFNSTLPRSPSSIIQSKTHEISPEANTAFCSENSPLSDKQYTPVAIHSSFFSLAAPPSFPLLI